MRKKTSVGGFSGFPYVARSDWPDLRKDEEVELLAATLFLFGADYM